VGGLLLVQDRSFMGERVTLYDPTTGESLHTYDGALVAVTDDQLVTSRTEGVDVWTLGAARPRRE